MTSVSGSGELHPPALGTYACVVDRDPRFHAEVLRWYAVLTELAGVAGEDLVVHVIGRGTSSTLRWLGEQGVSVRPIEPFDQQRRHTNKIAGALHLAGRRPNGICVLTDTDVAILEDLRRLPVPERAVAMKLVDIDNPPFETARRVFEAAGIPLPDVVAPDFAPDRRTLSINGNGGVYAIPATLLPELVESWQRWARWLLANREPLGLKRAFDQMSMALTIASCQLDVMHLDRRWNLPIHQPEWIREITAPGVLHYHQRVDRNGLVMLTGVPAVDERVRMANAAIAEVYVRARGKPVLRTHRLLGTQRLLRRLR